MSVRVEWMSVLYTSAEIVPAGTEIGEDVVYEGNVALVLSGDDVTVVEGSPERLRRMLTRALVALDEVAPPATPERE